MILKCQQQKIQDLPRDKQTNAT